MKLPYPVSHCGYLNTLPSYTPCIQRRMSMVGIFFREQELGVRCLNRTPSQISISTGTEPESRIAVGSNFAHRGGEIARDCMEQVLSTFLYSNKIYARGSQISQPPSYMYALTHTYTYILFSLVALRSDYFVNSDVTRQ